MQKYLRRKTKFCLKQENILELLNFCTIFKQMIICLFLVVGFGVKHNNDIICLNVLSNFCINYSLQLLVPVPIESHPFAINV